MKDQRRNNMHSTTTELDHGSLASVKTLLWTQQSSGAVVTHSCTAVLRHEDGVHGPHVDVIRGRFLLAARFKELLNCRDITDLHCVLLKRENAKALG